MSLAGVRSNRGDIYQTLVALDWALSILANDTHLWLEVDSTSLDASGNPLSVDDVVVGCKDGSMICCQCKKNQIDFKPWSITDHGDELGKAARFLADNPDSQVKFYSRSDFGALAKLREHARTQPNDNAYWQSLTADHLKTDAALASHLSGITGLSTYDWLQRTTFELSNEFERMKELLLERLAYLVSNADAAFDALWTKLAKLGARIVIVAVWLYPLIGLPKPTSRRRRWKNAAQPWCRRFPNRLCNCRLPAHQQSADNGAGISQKGVCMSIPSMN